MSIFYQDDAVTIYHGDALEILENLKSLFSSIISDPPYGINAVLGMGGGTKGDGGMWSGVGIAGDGSTEARDAVLLSAGVPFAVFAAVRIPAPPGTKTTVVWDKGEHTGAGDLSLPWKPSFELVHIGGTGWKADRRCGGVVKVNAVAGCVGRRNDGHRHHPFEKPLAVMMHFCSRAPEGTILDPFMGSGTTLRAAKDLGRRSIGIEIEERYCETAAKRMAQEVLL
jgi:DNA modification methylase